jgi:prophage maintenance system killer protein
VTKYLSLEFVDALNRKYCSDSTGFLSESGAAGAIGRPQHTDQGRDLIPDIWMKAATLLHGIAASQHWTNGNKRTGYLAAQAFLRINSVPLRELPIIDRLAFVAAVAENVLKLEQIAEWLKGNRLRASDRLDFAVLAKKAEFDEDAEGLWNGIHCSMSMIMAEETPASTELSLLLRIRWTRFDVGSTQRIATSIHTIDGKEGDAVMFSSFVTEQVTDNIEVWKSGHRNHKHGVMPTIVLQTLPLMVIRKGRVRIVVQLNGELLTALPLDIEIGAVGFDVPNSFSELLQKWDDTP